MSQRPQEPDRLPVVLLPQRLVETLPQPVELVEHQIAPMQPQQGEQRH